MEKNIILQEKINLHNEEREYLMKKALMSAGIIDEAIINRIIKKGMPQSKLFMIEIIPLIHRWYLHESDNTVKTALDIGPQNFAGTALLQEIHDPHTYNKLKLDVSAIDKTDKFSILKDILCSKVNFIKGDIYDLKGTWDFVIASHVIEHVDEPYKFVKRMQDLARDFAIIACPWNEYPLSNNTHVNTIDKKFIRSVGARDLSIYTNYSWGKSREVCLFWVPGRAL